MSEIQLGSILKRGLRQDARMWQGAARNCRNIAPTEYGLREIPMIQPAISLEEMLAPTGGDASSALITYTILNGKVYTLAVSDSSLYQYDRDAQTLTELEVHDIYDDGAVVVPLSSTFNLNATLADFGNTWFIFTDGWMTGNVITGPRQIFKTQWQNPARLYKQDNIHINTGCAYRGRLLMGGFDDTNVGFRLWDKWVTAGIWDAIVEKGFDDWGFGLVHPGKNWVWFSNIGGGDTLQFFLPETVQMGLDDITLRAEDEQYDVDDPLFVEYARRVQSGFLQMPFQGAVKRMCPMDNFVVVLGTDGIAGMQHYSAPIPTMGPLEAISGPGILGTAVAGDYRRYVYIGQDGNLWQVDSDLRTTKLGYMEYLNDLGFLDAHHDNDISNRLRVSHDAVRDEFYVSGYSLATPDLDSANSEMLVIDRYGARIQSPSVRSVLAHPDVYRYEDGWHLQSDPTVGVIVYNPTGAELVSNGDFAIDDSNWSPGSGWAWTAGRMRHVNLNSTYLIQYSADMVSPFVPRTTYTITFEVEVGAGILSVLGHSYIRTGRYCIVFTPDAVTDLVIFGVGNSGLHPTYIDNISIHAVADREVIWESGQIQVAGANTKTIRELQLTGSIGANSLIATIIYNLGSVEAEKETLPITFDSRGVAVIKQTCRDFRVRLTCANGANLRIDDIMVVFEDGTRIGLATTLA